MMLSKLVENMEGSKLYSEGDIDIKGIAYNSRKVKAGDLFVAIKGYKTNGDKYIGQAIENGAIAVVVEEYKKEYNIPQIEVRNSRKALSKIASIFYKNPSKDMKVVGITATNGKTSTAFMANAILEKNKLKTGVIGTVFVKYGDYMEPSILTTPESLDLQNHFYNMKRQNVDHAVIEVSSSALELNRVDNVDFDIVTFNNISREHLEVHGSFEEYFDVKSRLIKNLKKDGWAILNLDCPYSSSLVDKTDGNVLTYGVKNKSGDIYIEDLDLSSGRGEFTVVISKDIKIANKIYQAQKFKIKLLVPGYHSVYNSIVAIAISILSGVPIETIQEGIGEFKGVERRFEFIYDDEFKIIDDHFANVGNINVTLETLSMMDYKDLYLIYAIRGSRGVTTNRENAETIAKWASKLEIEKIIVTKSISHVMDKDKVLDEEVSVFKEVMDREGIDVYMYDELFYAINYGLSKTKAGDVLLLAGCQGMDYGAQIALEGIYNLRPDLNKKDLFKSISNRVAGIA